MLLTFLFIIFLCVDYCSFFRLVSSRNSGADTLLNLLLELSSIQFLYFVLCNFVYCMIYVMVFYLSVFWAREL